MIHVGIYIFDQVEVLDFTGPLEVFYTATRLHKRWFPVETPPFEVFTVSAGEGVVKARANLHVLPNYQFANHPRIDLLIIPGGVVTEELKKLEVIQWIRQQAANAQVTASVCTGAFLLGKAGLLDGKAATTHWEDIQELRSFLPQSQIVEGKRWVDQQGVVTSSGISAGLDMSLYLVQYFAGRELAIKTARQMEYDWLPDDQTEPN